GASNCVAAPRLSSRRSVSRRKSLNLKITARTYTKNHVFLNGKSTRILSTPWVEEQILFPATFRAKSTTMKRFADAELMDFFSDLPDVHGHRLPNEHESAEALSHPLTSRNFEQFSSS